MSLLELSAAAAGGGAFGVVGTALSRIAGYFEKRQEFEQERHRWTHETTLLNLQMQARQQETEAEIALAETEGSWSGLSASMNAEAQVGPSYKWVDAVRSLTRPVLTVLLWLITALIFYQADQASKSGIVESAVFAASAATLWWFGDRGATSRAQRGLS